MKKRGREYIPSPRLVLFVARLLVAAIDRVADGYGVAVDGSGRLGDREAVVFIGDELVGLGLGDSMVRLVDGLILGLIGTGANGASANLVHHFGISFLVCSLSTPKE